jgi:hypothetical protein
MSSSGPANLRAAGLTVLSMALFSVSDVVVKLLAADYPAGQIMAWRGALCGVLLALIVVLRPGERPGAVAAALRDPACWVRGLFEVGVAYCFFTALAHLPDRGRDGGPLRLPRAAHRPRRGRAARAGRAAALGGGGRRARGRADHPPPRHRRRHEPGDGLAARRGPVHRRPGLATRFIRPGRARARWR